MSIGTIAKECCGSCGYSSPGEYKLLCIGGNVEDSKIISLFSCCDNYSPRNPIVNKYQIMWEGLPFIIGQITDEEIYNIPLFSGHGTLDLKNLIIDKIKELEEKS